MQDAYEEHDKIYAEGSSRFGSTMQLACNRDCTDYDDSEPEEGEPLPLRPCKVRDPYIKDTDSFILKNRHYMDTRSLQGYGFVSYVVPDDPQDPEEKNNRARMDIIRQGYHAVTSMTEEDRAILTGCDYWRLMDENSYCKSMNSRKGLPNNKFLSENIAYHFNYRLPYMICGFPVDELQYKMYNAMDICKKEFEDWVKTPDSEPKWELSQWKRCEFTEDNELTEASKSCDIEGHSFPCCVVSYADRYTMNAERRQTIKNFLIEGVTVDMHNQLNSESMLQIYGNFIREKIVSVSACSEGTCTFPSGFDLENVMDWKSLAQKYEDNEFAFPGDDLDPNQNYMLDKEADKEKVDEFKLEIYRKMGDLDEKHYQVNVFGLYFHAHEETNGQKNIHGQFCYKNRYNPVSYCQTGNVADICEPF